MRVWIRGCVLLVLVVGTVGCRQRDVPVPAEGGVARGGGQIASPCGDAPCSPVVSLAAADRPATGTRLCVPRASLKALAEPTFHQQRFEMVRSQIEARGVGDRRVLAAMRLVPRHEFVPKRYRRYSYADTPLPIGMGQTISQPYIVALMTELLRPKTTDRVLEIGTGSGYQAAVLSLLVKEVYTIEILEGLAKRAERDLRRLGYDNVHVRCADGYRGWPEKAPFDGVIVTAAPERIPEPLVEQLRLGGRLVIPVGPQYDQELVVLHKTDRGLFRERVIPVRFVPMVGEAQKRREP